MRGACCLVLAVLMLTGCQSTGHQRGNFQYIAFEQACITYIGDGVGMADAVRKALPFYTPDIVPEWRDHTMRGPTTIKTRWYTIPHRGDLVHAEDGSYCRIGQFREDAMQVMETVANNDSYEIIENQTSPNGYRRMILRLTEKDGVIVLTEGSHANFLHVMTSELYMRQKLYNDPDIPIQSVTPNS